MNHANLANASTAYVDETVAKKRQQETRDLLVATSAAGASSGAKEVREPRSIQMPSSKKRSPITADVER